MYQRLPPKSSLLELGWRFVLRILAQFPRPLEEGKHRVSQGQMKEHFELQLAQDVREILAEVQDKSPDNLGSLGES